ncbi:hypothetical protein DFQ26_008381 [Actinomortierella ambigua]|nr:hypothetical protein DFQ26_008381 [Actinomortierella ambigua]
MRPSQPAGIEIKVTPSSNPSSIEHDQSADDGDEDYHGGQSPHRLPQQQQSQPRQRQRQPTAAALYRPPYSSDEEWEGSEDMQGDGQSDDDDGDDLYYDYSDSHGTPSPPAEEQDPTRIGPFSVSLVDPANHGQSTVTRQHNLSQEPGSGPRSSIERKSASPPHQHQHQHPYGPRQHNGDRPFPSVPVHPYPHPYPPPPPLSHGAHLPDRRISPVMRDLANQGGGGGGGGPLTPLTSTRDHFPPNHHLKDQHQQFYQNPHNHHYHPRSPHSHPHSLSYQIDSSKINRDEQAMKMNSGGRSGSGSDTGGRNSGSNHNNHNYNHNNNHNNVPIPSFPRSPEHMQSLSAREEGYAASRKYIGGKEGDHDMINGIDAKLERQVVRKLDWHIMPLVGTLYLFSYLDRVNIGNARLYGLEEAVHLGQGQYNV